MNEGNSEMKHAEQAPEAQIDTKRRFSIIWVVPIIALLIGGGLVFKAQSAKGPTITITFETADGLTAEKTKIKFKDVEIGTETQIDMGKDLANIVVTAELHKGAKKYLTDKTKFWVVRARIGAGEVSGLGTLFSGAYIGIDPSTEGTSQSAFKGLEIPPILTQNLPGGHYVLKATTLSSLDLGSPVYYRGIKVGKVVAHHYEQASEEVLINIFVKAPFHEKVFQNSRFWSASGVDFSMDASGFKMDTESLVSIMTGGLVFDLRQDDLPGEVAEEGRVFDLYPNRESSSKNTYIVKNHYLMFFDQSVRGLSPGAPVEIMGVKIGEVVKTALEYSEETKKFRIAVLVAMEPERVQALVSSKGGLVRGEKLTAEVQEKSDAQLLVWAKGLVANGLRAQLKTGSLLTGQLYVDLDYYPKAPAVGIPMAGDYPVFPTMGAPLKKIAERVDSVLTQFETILVKVDDILAKVDDIPITEIGNDVQAAIESLTRTLDEIKALSGNINKDTLPKVTQLLVKLEDTIDGISTTLGPDSELNYNAQVMTSELSMTMRSVRSLLEYLERDPQALMLGKEGDKK